LQNSPSIFRCAYKEGKMVLAFQKTIVRKRKEVKNYQNTK
jgi:hypothetical protein